MKVSYEIRADDLWIDFTDHPPVETRRVGDNALLRLDEFGNVVSMQIMNAKMIGINPMAAMIEILSPEHVVERTDPAETERTQTAIQEARERKARRDKHTTSA